MKKSLFILLFIIVLLIMNLYRIRFYDKERESSGFIPKPQIDSIVHKNDSTFWFETDNRNFRNYKILIKEKNFGFPYMESDFYVFYCEKYKIVITQSGSWSSWVNPKLNLLIITMSIMNDRSPISITVISEETKNDILSSVSKGLINDSILDMYIDEPLPVQPSHRK